MDSENIIVIFRTNLLTSMLYLFVQLSFTYFRLMISSVKIMNKWTFARSSPHVPRPVIGVAMTEGAGVTRGVDGSCIISTYWIGKMPCF